MSYEGYEQILCTQGHYIEQDVNAYTQWNEGKWFCPECGSPEAWRNNVNTTNGSWEDNGRGKQVRIDGYVTLEVDQPPKKCSCSSCGNVHNISTATYKIPKNSNVLEKNNAFNKTKV